MGLDPICLSVYQRKHRVPQKAGNDVRAGISEQIVTVGDGKVQKSHLSRVCSSSRPPQLTPESNALEI